MLNKGAYQRLRGRTLHEICFRARQEVLKRKDLAIYRLGLQRSTRYRAGSLDPAPQFFFGSAELPRILEVLHESFAAKVDEIQERAERLCAHEFDLLGFQKVRFGQEINWQLDIINGRQSPLVPWFRIPFLDFDTVGDHKIIWELNRQQHLIILAKAFLLSRNQRYLDELTGQWRHWVACNPYPLGINWASTLEVAFRSLSWIWVDHLLRDQLGVSNRFLGDLRCELGRHGRYLIRYLSTYFAPNTHLLGEGVALFFLGTLYPGLPGARRWHTTGWHLILEQLERQVRDDGLHFEQSIYYHVYALDFFLHALLLAERNGLAVPQTYKVTVRNMIEALVNVSPGGVPPRMGDDDGGRVFDPLRNEGNHMLDPVSTGAAMFGQSEWKAVASRPIEETLWLLGPERFAEYERMPVTRRSATSVGLRESGLYVMVDRREGNWRLLVDAGPQGAGRCGHGHADALSAQLASPNGDWLIDVGTSSYMHNPQRDRFRGTAAHNTLTVDGLDQAIPIGPFAWKSVPNVYVEHWITSPHFDYLCATHDGYKRLATAVIHRRTVVTTDGLWFIRDEAIGASSVDLVVSWHLAPRLAVMNPEVRRVDITDANDSLTILIGGPPEWEAAIDACEWSPSYGVTQPSRVIRLRCCPSQLTEVASVIALEACQGSLDYSCVDNAVAYEMCTGGQTYRFVFGQGPWQIGKFSGDHEFALYRGPSRQRLALVGSVASKGREVFV